MKKDIKENTYDWTTNRKYYNKLRKLNLANCGDIHCPICRYHLGENSTLSFYNIDSNGTRTNKYPSWKLVTKNRKQWMKKPYHFEEDFDLYWSGWTGNIYPYRDVPRIK